MATEAEIRRLTEAYRAAQARKAAQIAALVAVYYRTRVDVDSAASIQRWIDIMIPRIQREHDAIARLAVAYGNTLRRLEVPDAPAFEFTPSVGAVREQIERSLRVVGPEAYLRKQTEIRRMDIPPAMKLTLTDDARKAAEVKIAGAVARHTQNGGRQSLYDGIQEDPVCLGYFRVTKKDPCFFCAALASRGIVYGEDSFDESDARFTGSGNAKVHDSCGCSLKPVYDTKDPMLVDVANFEALWYQWASGSNPMLRFRQAYEGRPVTA